MTQITYASIQSEQRLFISCFDIIKYMVAISQITILSKVKRQATIRNLYDQIPHPALKTKREITKYINWRQFTKGTCGKQNEQLFPK